MGPGPRLVREGGGCCWLGVWGTDAPAHPSHARPAAPPQDPLHLVGDATLLELARRRPASQEQLALVPGMSSTAVQAFGAPLLEVVVGWCASSSRLKHSTDWSVLQRAR